MCYIIKTSLSNASRMHLLKAINKKRLKEKIGDRRLQRQNIWRPGYCNFPSIIPDSLTKKESPKWGTGGPKQGIEKAEQVGIFLPGRRRDQSLDQVRGYNYSRQKKICTIPPSEGRQKKGLLIKSASSQLVLQSAVLCLDNFPDKNSPPTACPAIIERQLWAVWSFWTAIH